jgi:hypothetical protein
MPNLDPWMNQQSEEESPKPSQFENRIYEVVTVKGFSSSC